MKKLLTVLTLGGVFFFILCAYWQFNDPDALRWVFVYGATSLMGLAVIFNRIPWQVPAVLALVTSGFSLYYIWIVIRQGLHYFEDEVGREMMGFVMVSLYMVFLVIHARVSRNQRSF